MAGKQMVRMSVLTAMVFTGALLLFGMEPLIGRLLTPYFGGAAHVWLTCLMFFQGMLLVGYLYAHLFARKMGKWHLLLLLLPLLNLPLTIQANPSPHAPLLEVLTTLFLHVTLPFAVLSTTAVVAQVWLSDSSLGKYYEPYPLYAASNTGSLLALAGYTFVAEPLMGLKMQSLTWSVLYLIYSILVVASWFLLRPHSIRPNQGDSPFLLSEEGPAPVSYLQWLFLSSLPSAFLLAITNYIALEVGSFPLTWVAPLALYLGSFIVTFRQRGGTPRYVAMIWPETILFSFVLYLWGPLHWGTVIVQLAVFFLICLIAHGTLYDLRPAPAFLTHFYLTIALGGWIGGAFVSLAAPFIFSGLFEYPILLILFGFVFSWCCKKPLSIRTAKFSLLIHGARVVAMATIVVLIGMESWAAFKEPVKFRHRNFYGTYRIKDEPPIGEVPGGMRKLLHGRTLHGAQFLHPDWQEIPVSYFYLGGGISEVYTTTPSPRKIAVLGLGAGAVAAYATEKDHITYYEIDPDNEGIARQWFSYLTKCRGKVKVIVGDGRLALQQSNPDEGGYDIIHMDAFTGDGIPTHLLTREAIQIYLRRLAQNGVILFHVSNRYYELRPVIKSTAAELGLYGAMNIPATRDKIKPYENVTWCVVLARNPERLQSLIDRGWVRLGDKDGLSDLSPWTDDYINILAPLMENLRYHLNRHASPMSDILIHSVPL